MSGPGPIIASDFNNDNLPDLAVGSYAYGFIAIFLGNGDGTFRNETRFPVGYSSSVNAIAAGDFNGDDCLDIVAVGYSIGVNVLFGNGIGGFSASMNIPSNVLTVPSYVVTGDFNHDGHLDLAAIDEYGDDGEVLLNDGDGHFRLSTALAFESYSQPNSLAAGDFNNDSRLDLAVVYNNKGKIDVLLGNQNGTFGIPTMYSTSIDSVSYSVVAGDFNNDSQLDLAVTIFNKHNVDIFLGIGNGTFLAPLEFFTREGSIVSTLVAGDFNSDGRLDLAVLDKANSSIIILMNTCVCCVN